MTLKHLTPDVALRILTDAPSPILDTVRRAYMESRDAEDVISWLLLSADVIAKKHPKSASSLPGMVAEAVGTRRAGEQAATS